MGVPITPGPVALTPPGGGPSAAGVEVTGAGASTVLDALRFIGSTPDAPPLPENPFEHPAETAKAVYGSTWYALNDAGVPRPLCFLLAGLTATVELIGASLGATAFWLLRVLGTEFFKDVLTLVDDARKTLDPNIPLLSTVVLNELLGTDFKVPEPTGETDFQAHMERARLIGNRFHDQLTAEFTEGQDVSPEQGASAARKMSGFLVNFATATALVAVLGEFLSFGKFEQFREMGVTVAENLGLGRMHRAVMKPLVEDLIALPYGYYLNQKFHPKRLTLQEVVNPFAQQLMDAQAIQEIADLQGYRSGDVEQLVKMHQKKLPISNLEMLIRWGALSQDDAVARGREYGYNEQDAQVVIASEALKRSDSRLTGLVDAVVARFENNAIDDVELAAFLDKLALTDGEKEMITAEAQYKRKTPSKRLSILQLEKAFAEGIINLDEFQAYLKSYGFSDADTEILTALELLAVEQKAEAAKVKANKAAGTAARAAAKTARAAALPTPPKTTTPAG